MPIRNIAADVTEIRIHPYFLALFMPKSVSESVSKRKFPIGIWLLILILESSKQSKTRDHHRACFAEKNPERSIKKICICFCALDFFPENTLGDGPKKPRIRVKV